MTRIIHTTCDECECMITSAMHGSWVVQYKSSLYDWGEMHFCNYSHMFKYLESKSKKIDEIEKEKF